MKIGIMGGTFDPIHNAHITIAKRAKEQFTLNKVIFMPSGNPPHKSEITDKNIRFDMVKLAIKDEFEISDYEIKKEEFSYTLNTLKHFHTIYPDDELYFIIGEDSLNDIYKWYKPKEILSMCNLLVFPRISKTDTLQKAQEVMMNLGGNIQIIDAPITQISSTQIRAMLKENKNVDNMLPKEVLKYINENNLYR